MSEFIHLMRLLKILDLIKFFWQLNLLFLKLEVFSQNNQLKVTNLVLDEETVFSFIGKDCSRKLELKKVRKVTGNYSWDFSRKSVAQAAPRCLV